MTMKGIIITLVFVIFSTMSHAQHAFRKIDTTMKLGKAGYKISCKNANEEKNYVSLNPIGFKNTARDFGFDIKGRI
ncbi:hypothetical protein, partial [Streptococcus suis]|uniref:hypothetical protein n=2 Tax=Bacteria TaxID=2 RepID=UPI00370B0FA6